MPFIEPTELNWTDKEFEDSRKRLAKANIECIESALENWVNPKPYPEEIKNRMIKDMTNHAPIKLPKI